MNKVIMMLVLIAFSKTMAQQPIFKDKFDDAIPVLNFGTFHMGFTSDANSVDFDENDRKNQEDVKKVAKMLAEFKPTVIIVETPPSFNEALQKEYSEYLKNPNMTFENPSEIELLAYEVGRLNNAQRIYGIDHKMGYNYNIGNTIQNKVNDKTYEKYFQLIDKEEKKLNYDNLSLLDKLKVDNHPQYLDFLINVNAEILSYVSTKDKFEGADEAAKYYHRNIRMYSNLNQIELNENDRVFILMGASHTAYFNDFMKRSPKYKLVDPFLYLK
ncbi:MAG: DUF5694 domain-containing protein [Flavobacterium sp.]|jgi:hypothetical protein|uniref:DUF5694 domain-containing protein n=1 Tax=Flavobacterium TaxID=237 RepID=UPI0022BA87BD|nr:DUF5694 domain-containing protein [Flavobacterium sp.]MCZ8089909.1 DUF5694 domain-containing protein [Flavobacterium sp.]MCZ8332151.1 DUF5694 domain-containing protein [Flavobacterium sp.]